MQVRRGAFTAVVVAGSLALAACTGGGESPPSATSSTTSSSSSSTTSSTTTQSPSATKTVALPPEATKHTEAGAVAFAKYFLQVSSEAFVEGDGSTVRALSESSCTGCGAIARAADNEYADGLHPATARFVFRDSNVQPSSSGDLRVIDVIGTERSVAMVDAAGAEKRRTKAEPSWTRSTVRWTGREWVMQDFAVVKQS
ncbi:DUF6318 family protein [Phycicoccus sp. M110.8]|uniref:DUF6318 family protein n=1 Tax=Phycicoccus sp. M110.8 TaxID=3075433 RepID=UPI0028FD303B|nr:DUF6318 family protein [Phycicoccus sp. M110.8]MDU0314427.1 DUF6318 family protein [Phycicoccus sp. M110.8]